MRKAALSVAHVDEQEPAADAPGALLGESAAMRRCYELIRRSARSHATVLLRGETGTGKELAARAIHSESDRSDASFIKVHCAALPDALLESELFGYEKGAFTGAVQRKLGRVDLAAGGTLFLDEIGDITPSLQVKLLRLLQDREYERLGGTKTLRADVRFVAATHRDLEGMVASGAFREDLFYRLNVVPIVLPPLRDRREDVSALALHFRDAMGAAHGFPGIRFESGVLEAFEAFNWPGNVRQLLNLVERLVVLSDGMMVTIADVRRELDATSIPAPAARPEGVAELSSSRDEAERAAIVRALAKANNNRTVAARILGVSRRTLYNKLKTHGIVR